MTRKPRKITYQPHAIEYEFIDKLKTYGIVRMECQDAREAKYISSRIRIILNNAGCRNIAIVGFSQNWIYSWMVAMYSSYKTDSIIKQFSERPQTTLVFRKETRLQRDLAADTERLETFFGQSAINKKVEERRNFITRRFKEGKINEIQFNKLITELNAD